jgi:hypothetical protein
MSSVKVPDGCRGSVAIYVKQQLVARRPRAPLVGSPPHLPRSACGIELADLC